MAPNAPPVNHLLFGDDCLLLFKANSEAAIKICQTIDEYCAALGQKVNLAKSSLFSERAVQMI